MQLLVGLLGAVRMLLVVAGLPALLLTLSWAKVTVGMLLWRVSCSSLHSSWRLVAVDSKEAIFSSLAHTLCGIKEGYNEFT